MGSEARHELRNIPINFSPTEIQRYTQTFMRFDYNKDGHITVLDIRKVGITSHNYRFSLCCNNGVRIRSRGRC